MLDDRRLRSDTSAPAAPETAAPLRTTFSDMAGGIPSFAALGIAVAWIAVLMLTFNLEPAADPEATISALDVVVAMAFWYGLLAVLPGLAFRRRWGLAASLWTGGVLFVAGVLCVMTGHTGPWVAAQLIGGAGMAAASLGTLRATA